MQPQAVNNGSWRMNATPESGRAADGLGSPSARERRMDSNKERGAPMAKARLCELLRKTGAPTAHLLSAWASGEGLVPAKAGRPAPGKGHQITLLDRWRRPTAAAVFGVALALMRPSPARASSTSVPWPTIDQLVTAAELIFVGSVVDVSYHDSLEVPGRLTSLPHTFVRFQIGEILRGSVRSGQTNITLRLLGGGSIGKRGFLSVSGQPVFDVGERGLLFVKGNTRAACPIVSCAAGRFREIDALAWTDEGRELGRSATDDSLMIGPRRELPEVRDHLANGALRQLVEVESPDDRTKEPEPSLENRLTFEDLLTTTQESITRLTAAALLRKVPVTPSADPSRPFAIQRLAEAAPREPRTEASPVPEEPRTEEERLEAEAYAAAEGNPVLTPPRGHPTDERGAP